jgi:hypothetical protein
MARYKRCAGQRSFPGTSSDALDVLVRLRGFPQVKRDLGRGIIWLEELYDRRRCVS